MLMSRHKQLTEISEPTCPMIIIKFDERWPVPLLIQVWEEQDHMQPEDFDPKTFFHLHGRCNTTTHLFLSHQLTSILLHKFCVSLSKEIMQSLFQTWMGMATGIRWRLRHSSKRNWTRCMTPTLLRMTWRSAMRRWSAWGSMSSGSQTPTRITSSGGSVTDPLIS